MHYYLRKDEFIRTITSPVAAITIPATAVGEITELSSSTARPFRKITGRETMYTLQNRRNHTEIRKNTSKTVTVDALVRKLTKEIEKSKTPEI